MYSEKMHWHVYVIKHVSTDKKVFKFVNPGWIVYATGWDDAIEQIEKLNNEAIELNDVPLFNGEKGEYLQADPVECDPVYELTV